LGGSVPHAIKLKNELGKDGLECLLIESQNLAANEIPLFMAQKFPTNDTILTNEQPFKPAGWEKAGGGLPYACLIGADGTMLWEGRPNGAPKKIEELIEAEIKKIKAGWGKTPEIKKARAAMHSKGNLGEAATILASIAEQVPADAKDDFDAAQSEVQALYSGMKSGIETAVKEGRYTDAQKLASALAKGVKGKADWEAEVAPLVADLQTPEAQKEIKLCAAVEKIYNANGTKAPKEDQGKKLRDLAKKNEGLKTAAYAVALANACEYKPH
jgi:hypothetical protein